MFFTMIVNKNLIDRFFKGECTDDEVQAVMNWMHSPLAEKELSEDIENHWQTEDYKEISVNDWDDSLIKDRTLHKIFGENRQHKSKSISRINAVRWVAAVVSFIIISVGIYYFTLNRNSPAATSQSIALITKQNPKGHKSRIFLPDGSVVWLNAESKLTYPERFEKANRQIHLVGEAFFEVAKDVLKPFIVSAGNTATHVLGTRFNVKAYEEDSCVTVTLEEGKVQVDQDNGQNEITTLTLEPGEGITASQNEATMRKFKFDPEQYTAWKDGVLHFSKADMMMVIRALERWYGVSITIRNYQADDWSFSGSFKNEYLSNVLLNLSYTREFDYVINNKDVMITFK